MALKPRPTPDYEKDPNVQTRKHAARRSANRNAGKPVDAEPEITAPVEGEAEGGVVAEAEKELAGAKTETAEQETPAVEAEEQATGGEEAEAEKPAEETPAEEKPAEEVPAPEGETETPVEETPAPEAESETPAEEEPEESGEYQAPEGESHVELVRKYIEAIAYGDVDSAVELYFQLQDHRYRENKHRAKQEAVSERDAREHLAVAKEVAAKYPELNEDGLASDKVLALADVYRQQGSKPAAALRQAVADLYKEQQASTTEPEALPAESQPMAETAAEEPVASPGGEEASSPIPDMEERNLRKRAIAEVPAASARNEPAPPPEKPTRTGAIEQMKAARGQR